MILRARAIWAGRGRIIGDASVRIRGDRITGVGGSREIFPDDGEAVVDIGDSVIFPAFVNAHCHLEYTGLAGELSQGDSFSEWLNQMVAIKQSLTHDDLESAWLAGADMLLRTGCGAVVNIESLPGLYRRMASATPLQVCPFIELIGYHPGDVSELLELAKRELLTSEPRALSAGLSPHSLYTLTPEALNVLGMFADEYALSTTIHLAESGDEWDMFANGKGALYEMMTRLGRLMDDCGLGTPVQHLVNSAGFPKKTLVVHANRLTDTDVGFLRRADADVVHCPRSYVWFGHNGFEYDRFTKAGLNVCLGTDSLASIGEAKEDAALDMFAEMQEFARCNPSVGSEEILQMATENGAKALRLGSELAQVKEGFRANLAMIPFSGSLLEVPEMILNHNGSVDMLMIAGRRVFSIGNSKVS